LLRREGFASRLGHVHSRVEELTKHGVAVAPHLVASEEHSLAKEELILLILVQLQKLVDLVLPLLARLLVVQLQESLFELFGLCLPLDLGPNKSPELPSIVQHANH